MAPRRSNSPLDLASPPRGPLVRFKRSNSLPLARRLFPAVKKIQKTNNGTPSSDTSEEENDNIDSDTLLEKLQAQVLEQRALEFKKRWSYDIINDMPIQSPDSQWIYTRIL